MSSPSMPTLIATWVPRMPMVATGVSTSMASGPDLAISPETNENTPWTTENAEEPSPVVGSKINSSSTMRPSSSMANVESSMNTMLTVASSAVSMTSPWNTGSPSPSAISVPEARTAETVPSTVSTVPMGWAPSVSSAWAYSPGASDPASLAASSGPTFAPPSVIRTGGSATPK